MDTLNNHALRSTHFASNSKSPGDSCRVMAALQQSPYGSLRRVRCEMHEGMAVLHGKVPTFYLKQLAQELVKKIDTVELVVNRIHVGYQ